MFLAVNLANLRLARETKSSRLISGLAALSTAGALVVLCMQVGEKATTRSQLAILAGMVAVSFAIEVTYRKITGRKIEVVKE